MKFSTATWTLVVSATVAVSSVDAFGSRTSFVPKLQTTTLTELQQSSTSSTTTASSTTTTIKKGPSVRLKPTLFENGLNNFQIWALRHPEHFISKLLLPPISLVEGLVADVPTYLDRKRAMFGHNFCVAGQVVLGNFTTLEKALTEPQARTFRLGTSLLNQDRLMVNGRKLFPLALSDPQIHGKDYNDGNMHAEVRAMVSALIINDKAIQRQSDATAKRLLQEVAQDYQEMDHSVGGAFFTAYDRGLQRFLVRYQHYILFGLDPDNKSMMDFFSKLYFESNGTAYFIAGMGNVIQALNINGAKDWPNMWEQAKKIYLTSPALSLPDAASSLQQFGDISLDELVQLVLPLLGIAALPGPLSLAKVALGGAPFPAYHGHATQSIDSATYWDEIPDLNDRAALERHVYECGRLWTPVSATHRVATEDFTVPMVSSSVEEDNDTTLPSSNSVTFPAGTIILTPMILGMLEEEFWGPTTYDYDASRPNLCPFSMIFHSVGSRSNGRICPGKDLSMNLMVDLLRELGQVRRRSK